MLGVAADGADLLGQRRTITRRSRQSFLTQVQPHASNAGRSPPRRRAGPGSSPRIGARCPLRSCERRRRRSCRGRSRGPRTVLQTASDNGRLPRGSAPASGTAYRPALAGAPRPTRTRPGPADRVLQVGHVEAAGHVPARGRTERTATHCPARSRIVDAPRSLRPASPGYVASLVCIDGEIELSCICYTERGRSFKGAVSSRGPALRPNCTVALHLRQIQCAPSLARHNPCLTRVDGRRGFSFAAAGSTGGFPHEQASVGVGGVIDIEPVLGVGAIAVGNPGVASYSPESRSTRDRHRPSSSGRRRDEKGDAS